MNGIVILSLDRPGVRYSRGCALHRAPRMDEPHQRSSARYFWRTDHNASRVVGPHTRMPRCPSVYRPSLPRVPATYTRPSPAVCRRQSRRQVWVSVRPIAHECRGIRDRMLQCLEIRRWFSLSRAQRLHAHNGHLEPVHEPPQVGRWDRHPFKCLHFQRNFHGTSPACALRADCSPSFQNGVGPTSTARHSIDYESCSG